MVKPYVARPISGGIDTKTPQTGLDPSMSPDLQNVMMNNHAVELRPGFTPLFKEHAKLNSVKNAGFHGQAAASTAGGSVNVEHLIVPGHMVAGHRKIFETMAAVTIECDIEIGDLTVEHGGNGEPSAGAGFGPAPYKLQVRPILTKGPLHRTDDELTAHSITQANIAWDTTVTTEWGDRTDEALPC